MNQSFKNNNNNNNNKKKDFQTPDLSSSTTPCMATPTPGCWWWAMIEEASGCMIEWDWGCCWGVGLLTDAGELTLAGSDWLLSASSDSEHEPQLEPPLPPLPPLPPPPPPALCVLTCFDRWSERMKRLLHTGQAKRFSPVWVRRWRCNSSERVKRLPQKSQLQTNGRSPVCQRRWAFLIYANF